MSKWGWKEKLENLWRSSFQGLKLNQAGELAIDFGTANIRIYLPGTGVIINEPTVIAYRSGDGEVVAVGREAKEMAGREPRSIVVSNPIKNGVIADCESAAKLLSQLISRASQNYETGSPSLLICVPADITPLEQKTYEDTARQAGAGKVRLIEEPYAAAASANLKLGDARANMVIDIGAGTTDIAVISGGGILHASTRRVGGQKIDRAIARYLHNERMLEISDETAEMIKIELGSVDEQVDERAMAVRGRNLTTALPEEITVTSEEIRPLILPILRAIQQQVRIALEEIPTEASVDLLDSGITLSGGLAQLPGLADFLCKELGLNVRVADDAMMAAISGAGRLLESESDDPNNTATAHTGLEQKDAPVPLVET